MENHTEPRVEGVDQRLEETSCGWRLWISSGLVDHIAHAIILYLERMCRVCLLELSDKQVDSNTVQQQMKYTSHIVNNHHVFRSQRYAV